MKFVKLGTVCKLRNGYAFKSNNFSDIGVPIIRISNINDNIVTSEKSVRTTFENIFDNYKIIKGDILIAMSGATTGKFGIYNSDEVAYQNQRVGCFKILDNSVINQIYLLQVLNTIKPIIEKTANGGAQPNISANAIEEIIIPLPSLPEQIRIAEILTLAENLIIQRKESIALLDEFVKSTFYKMFGDPVRNEKKWEKTFLDKIANQITDGEHTTPIRIENGIKLLSARNIKDGFLDFTSGLDYISIEEYERIAKRCKPQRNDILMSCSGSVGRVCVINTDEPLALVRSVALIKPIETKVKSYYLQYWMQSSYFQNEVKKSSKTSSQSNIFTGAIKKLPIIIPPLDLQNQFATIVEKAEVLKGQFKESLNELENLFGALSQKAFKGELDLSKTISKDKGFTIDISEIETTEDAKKANSITQTSEEEEEDDGGYAQGHYNQHDGHERDFEWNLLDKLDQNKIAYIEKSFSSFSVFLEDKEKIYFSYIGYDSFENRRKILLNKLSENYFVNHNQIKTFNPKKNEIILKNDMVLKVDLDYRDQFFKTFESNDKDDLFKWNQVSFAQVSNWIKDKYKGYHFNSEMLFRFLMEEHVTFPNYFSSEELKTNPKLNEADDVKSFVFSALNGENPFIKLEQIFYDDLVKNHRFKLTDEDIEYFEKNKLKVKSGVYFKIVE